MKVQVISDVHPGSWGQSHVYREDWLSKVFIPNIKTDADVLVIAGDTVSMRPVEQQRAKETLKAFCDNWKNVVYCMGNHDIWGRSPI
jgi:predicted MPP superfamily phosphohydrolase